MRKETEQIGVLGGTFNPIHNGHLTLARAACAQYGLSRVLFLPTGHTAYKEYSGEEMSAHRARMVELAIEGDAQFVISYSELESEEIGYTYRTLEEMKEAMPDASLFFLLGADSLKDFPNWRFPERICAASALLVAAREGANEPALDEAIENVRARFFCDVRRVDMPNVDISSREIRDRVKHGEEIRGMVPDAVAQYIEEHQLYGETVEECDADGSQ